MKLTRTFLAALCIASVTLVAAASARTAHRTGVPAQVALDWNTNAVNTIRTAVTTVDGPARPLYQTEGLTRSVVRPGGGLQRRHGDRRTLRAVRALALRPSRGLACRGRRGRGARHARLPLPSSEGRARRALRDLPGGGTRRAGQARRRLRGPGRRAGHDRHPLERRSQRAHGDLRRARCRRRRSLAGRAAGHGGTDPLGGIHAPVPAPAAHRSSALRRPGARQSAPPSATSRRRRRTVPRRARPTRSSLAHRSRPTRPTSGTPT